MTDDKKHILPLRDLGELDDDDTHDVEMPKVKTIQIEIKRLQDIARYYEFPLAVFFGGEIPKGTRKEKLFEKVDKLDKIKEILDE